MKVIGDEFLNEDAPKPEHRGLYEINDSICNALSRYARNGSVDQSIKDPLEKIIKNWYDLGYEKSDASQRDHTAGLFVIAHGEFRGYVGRDMEDAKKFSTAYTDSMSLEELRSILRKWLKKYQPTKKMNILSSNFIGILKALISC